MLTVEITQAEYRELLKAKCRLEILENYLETTKTSYLDSEYVRTILSKGKEERE